jgi:integrase
MKIKLTEKRVEALIARVPTKDRVDYWDLLLPNFGLRATKKGARTYIVGSRFGGGPYRRREVGDARVMKLAAAKKLAREWLDLSANGKDPAVVEDAKRREEARRRTHTFESVADAFIAEAVVGPDPEKPRQRRWKEVKRQTGILIAKWGSRSIHDIHRDELVRFVKERGKAAPAESRNLLGVAKQLFGWARDQDLGIEHNIAADIKPGRIIGPKVTRERALSTDEIRTLWAKVSAMPYPYGPAYQLLILTGLRLNECVQARRGEIDLKARVWTVPASRMKGKRPHKVPLTPRMIAILEELPKLGGDCVFSTSGGELPISLGSKIKDRLDAELKFGESWQNHDLRRSIRSGLAELGVSDVVAEAVLAHRQPGILAVYNKHPYLDERRDALERWGDVVDPPSNVTPLRQKSHARAW